VTPTDTPVTEQAVARRASRAEFVTRLFVVGLLVLLIAAVVTIFQVRGTQLEGTPTGRKLVASADRTLDCSEPTGECYQRNQKRLVAVIGEIGAANILTVVCALNVPDGTSIDAAVEQVTQCVTNRLAAAKP